MAEIWDMNTEITNTDITVNVIIDGESYTDTVDGDNVLSDVVNSFSRKHSLSNVIVEKDNKDRIQTHEGSKLMRDIGNITIIPKAGGAY